MSSIHELLKQVYPLKLRMELFNAICIGWRTGIKEKDQQIKELEEENQKLKQAQKQVAIEELEFVLKNFRNRPTYFDVARQELCLSKQDKQFIDFINNRIKELKGVDIHA